MSLWTLQADALDPPARARSRWYCDRPDCDGKPHDGFGKHARTLQHPPEGVWVVWYILAGRRGGKTRAGAEWINDRVRNGRAKSIALVGRTPAAVRDVMVEGPSGILACSFDDFRPVYHPTMSQVTWPNGAVAHTYSAEVPASLRGPGHDTAWCDEVAAWTDARKGDAQDTAWTMLMLTMSEGTDPRVVVTTTPQQNALTRVIRSLPTTRTVTWTTYDNLDNLTPLYRQQTIGTYEGTRIGRQELMAELLEDVPGALWTLELFRDREGDDGRLLTGRVEVPPEMRRLVVGVDPSGSDSKGADECGIVVVGKGIDGHGYVLADRTVTASPAEWARRAVAAYREFGADKIVAEGNYGGLMVVETIKAVDKTVPVEIVTASRSKRQRAEPVAALYEQGRVHHVGQLAKLEDELISWTPESGWSPGRMDALVWAVSWLNLAGGAAGENYLAFLAAQTEARAATTCPGRPNGHHLWRDGLCTLCNEPKEAA